MRVDLPFLVEVSKITLIGQIRRTGIIQELADGSTMAVMDVIGNDPTERMYLGGGSHREVIVDKNAENGIYFIIIDDDEATPSFIIQQSGGTSGLATESKQDDIIEQIQDLSKIKDDERLLSIDEGGSQTFFGDTLSQITLFPNASMSIQVAGGDLVETYNTYSIGNGRDNLVNDITVTAIDGTVEVITNTKVIP